MYIKLYIYIISGSLVEVALVHAVDGEDHDVARRRRAGRVGDARRRGLADHAGVQHLRIIL